jgi:nucleotide-binding universal stress UspA family protein
MQDAEDASRGLLERAGATGDSYGVRVKQKLVRARDAARAIVEQAESDRTELIVIGTQRAELEQSPRRLAPDTVLRVLNAARCRVLVASASAARAA